VVSLVPSPKALKIEGNGTYKEEHRPPMFLLSGGGGGGGGFVSGQEEERGLSGGDPAPLRP